MIIEYPTAYLKAHLLEKGTVQLSDRIGNKYSIDVENHHSNPWIFIKLTESSRVRLTVTNDEPELYIDLDENGNISLSNYKSKNELTKILCIEDAIIHAPEQLFLGLYEYCNQGCIFCPLSLRKDRIHYSLDSIYEDIESSNNKQYTSIGITTSIPHHLSLTDVADEMIFIVQKIREKIGSSIPIGVSTKTPSIEKMYQLKAAGANEMRLNIEIPNVKIAKKLMPKKDISEIEKSVKNAVKVFGRGKVSSNLIVGLGESDRELLDYVDKLASFGAIATLYPYDPIDIDDEDENNGKFSRPTATRLYNLAINHKKILEKYGLLLNTLETMCPACSASHLFPGRDL